MVAVIVQSVNLSDDGCMLSSKSLTMPSHTAVSLHNDSEALYSTHNKLQHVLHDVNTFISFYSVYHQETMLTFS